MSAAKSASKAASRAASAARSSSAGRAATAAKSASKAAAKAICADYLDPDEAWTDQDEHCLETALEGAIEELFNEHLLNFPAVISSKIEDRAIALKLDASTPTVELEYLEVEA